MQRFRKTKAVSEKNWEQTDRWTDGHIDRHVETMRKGCTPKWALEGVCQIVCFESFQFWKKCV